MAEDTSANVKIGAEIEGLKKGLTEAQNAVKNASSQINNSFATMQGAFTKFNAALIAVGAGLAGGAFFKGAIDSAVSLQIETSKLARQMGITADEALGLRYAIGDLYISNEQFSAAIGKLTMGVQDGGTKFAKMGVNVKDAHGNLKPMKDILFEVNKKINEYTVGADKNAAAAYFYGKQWQEVSKILNLTQDAMDAGSEKAKELGISLDADAVDKYRAAMNDAEDVTEALHVKIGQALLPSVTALSVYFSQIAVPVVNAVIIIFKGLLTAVDSLTHGFYELYLRAKLFVDSIWSGITTLSKSLVSLATDGVDAAVEVWKQGNQDFLISRKETLDEMSESDKNYFDRMNKLWTDVKSTPLQETKTEGASFVSPKSDDDAKAEAKRAMKEYENNYSKFVENLRAKNGEFYEVSKQEEHDFWATCLADANTKGKEYANVRLELEKKVRDLQHEARKEDLQHEIESLKFKASLDSENAQLKADVYSDIFKKISTLYGKDTREYREALLNKMAADKEYEQKKIQIETETAQKIEAIRNTVLDVEQNNLETSLQMGMITEEEKLQAVKNLEEERYRIKSETLDKELELNRTDLEKTRQLNDQKQILDAEYAAKKKNIDNSIMVASSARWVSMANSMQSSLSTAFQNMANGTQSFSSFVKGIVPAIGQAFMKVVADMAAQWIIKHTIMRAISAIFATEEATTTALVTAEQIAASKAAAMGQIPALTEIGAMGAFSAMAPIPIVGPALAAAAYASAQALGASSLAIASASGGFDIPSGVNPMTQLHQEEMVLPAHIANPLRDSLANGGLNSSGATNINITALDAKSVKSLFMEHGSTLLASLKNQNRAFAK